MCAGVHSGYVGSAWPSSLLGEKDAFFFSADVHSRFHPAFKAMPKGRKMNWHALLFLFKSPIENERVPLCALG